MSLPREHVSCAILTGGLSTRMGSDKALLHLRGRPLWAWVRDTFFARCAEVFVVGRPDASFGDVRVVQDVGNVRSSMTGLYSALIASTTSFCFVVACDAPFIDARLVDILMGSAFSDTAALIPMGPAGRQPCMALYHHRLASGLGDALLQKRYRLMDFLSFNHTACLPWSSLQKLGIKEECFWNLNTPEALRQAEDFLEGQDASTNQNSGFDFK